MIAKTYKISYAFDMIAVFKRVLFLSSFILVSLFFTQTIYADTPSPTPDCSKGCPLSSSNFNYLINGQTTLEGSVGQELFCGLLGSSPLNQCSGFMFQSSGQPSSQLLLFNHLPNGGALGMLSSTMVAMYTNQPTSAISYLADLGQNIGIIPQKAYAQTIGGSGNAVIAPVLVLWKTMRNVTYVFFALLFIIVGILIMLRQNIGSHGASLEITAQQALPGLVVGLILVTFSYFISALLVDMTFVGTDLVITLFTSTKLPNTFAPDPSQGAKPFRDLAQNSGVVSFITSTVLNLGSLAAIEKGVFLQTEGLLPDITQGNFGFIAPLKGLIAPITGGVLPILVLLILLIALVFQMFKLVFSLLVAYIEILVLTILSPIFILIGSIPGRGEVVSMWWKGILANSLAFPAVFAVFLFAGMILGSGENFDITLPMFGNLSGDLLKVVLGFVIILGSPAVPGMVKNTLGVKGFGDIAKVGIGGFAAGAVVPTNAGRAATAGFYNENLARGGLTTFGKVLKGGFETLGLHRQPGVGH